MSPWAAWATWVGGLTLLYHVLVAAWDRSQTVKVWAPNEVVPEHVEEVVRTMRRLGRPRLRAVRLREGWALLEGSHRLAAALRLGVGVEVVPWPGGAPVPGHQMVAREGGAAVPPDVPARELLATCYGRELHYVPARRLWVRRPVIGALPSWLW